MVERAPPAGHHMPPPSELSRRIHLQRLEERPVELEIEADATEREALCRRFGLEGLQALRANVRLEKLDEAEVYRLEGSLHADVTQLCVVTLEPLHNVVEGSFATNYVPEEEASLPGEIEHEVDPDEEAPEPFHGDSIDVGEAVAQEFASMLDPYPRAPDARIESDYAGEAESRKPSPFAALEKLKTPRAPDPE